jgi:hypothetical protein
MQSFVSADPLVGPGGPVARHTVWSWGCSVRRWDERQWYFFIQPMPLSRHCSPYSHIQSLCKPMFLSAAANSVVRGHCWRVTLRLETGGGGVTALPLGLRSCAACTPSPFPITGQFTRHVYVVWAGIQDSHRGPVRRLSTRSGNSNIRLRKLTWDVSWRHT